MNQAHPLVLLGDGLNHRPNPSDRIGKKSIQKGAVDVELRSTREMRRNEQLTKTMANKTEGQTAAAQTKPAQMKSQPPADKLTLSRQALSFLEEQNRKLWEQDMEREQRRQDRMNDCLSSIESKKKELDAMDKALKVLRICQKIAASIMKGDRVPPEDLKYLMDNDPEGYKMAMALRRHKEDPEDVESALEEEDKNGEAEAASSGESPQSAPAPEAPSGGETDSAPTE